MASYDSFATVLAELRALGSLVHDYDFGVASGNITDTVGSEDLVVAVGAGSVAYGEADPTGGTDAVKFNAGAKSETTTAGNWPLGDASRTIIVVARSDGKRGDLQNLFGYANTGLTSRGFVFQSREGNGDPMFSNFFMAGSSEFQVNLDNPTDGTWKVLALTHESTAGYSSIHVDETFAARNFTLNTETTTEGPSVPYDALAGNMWYSHCLVFDEFIGGSYINRLALGLKNLKYGV